MQGIDSSLWVKICGLVVPEQAIAIARQGASAIGFICVPSSPRYVTPLQIRAMSEALLMDSWAAVERVGVFVNAAPRVIEDCVSTGLLTTLQLHGQESPVYCDDLRQRYPNLKLIKAFRLRTQSDLLNVKRYANSVDAILLDAYHPHLMGGTGETLDWRSLQTFQSSTPWILAGGLTPENVQTALEMLRPHGIDLSSGVETAPGNKCLSKTQTLFEILQGRSPTAASS